MLQDSLTASGILGRTEVASAVSMLLSRRLSVLDMCSDVAVGVERKENDDLFSDAVPPDGRRTS